MSELVSHVHVYDKNQNAVAFGPGDEVPGWAAKQMGAHCFVGGEHPNAGTEREAGSVPPKAGAGSSKDAWAAYAATQEVDVPETASRDEIIAAIEAAGKPVDA